MCLFPFPCVAESCLPLFLLCLISDTTETVFGEKISKKVSIGGEDGHEEKPF